MTSCQSPTTESQLTMHLNQRSELVPKAQMTWASQNREKNETVWVENADSIFPWLLPITLGQSMDNDTIVLERFLCRKCPVWEEVCSNVESYPWGYQVSRRDHFSKALSWILRWRNGMPNPHSSKKGSCNLGLTKWKMTQVLGWQTLYHS